MGALQCVTGTGPYFDMFLRRVKSANESPHRLMIQHDAGSATLPACTGRHLTEADLISPGLHHFELYEQSQVLKSASIIQHSGTIPSLIVTPDT